MHRYVAARLLELWVQIIGQSLWPRGLMHRYVAARLLNLWVQSDRVHGHLSVVSVVTYRSLRQADHSSRGVLPTVAHRL